MNFIEALKSVFTKYATFSGRARRSEYWYFTLFYYMVIWGISLLDFIPGFMALLILFSLIVFVPSLSLMTRRLHDVGKSGWLVVINYALEFIVVILVLASIGFENILKVNNSNIESMTENMNVSLSVAAVICGIIVIVYDIYMLFLTIKDSQYGENKFGPNPKGLDGTNNY